MLRLVGPQCTGHGVSARLEFPRVVFLIANAGTLARLALLQAQGLSGSPFLGRRDARGGQGGVSDLSSSAFLHLQLSEPTVCHPPISNPLLQSTLPQA